MEADGGEEEEAVLARAARALSAAALRALLERCGFDAFHFTAKASVHTRAQEHAAAAQQQLRPHAELVAAVEHVARGRPALGGGVGSSSSSSSRRERARLPEGRLCAIASVLQDARLPVLFEVPESSSSEDDEDSSEEEAAAEDDAAPARAQCEAVEKENVAPPPPAALGAPTPKTRRLRKVAASLTCQVCLEEYDPATRCPKILPCFHTFCLECLLAHAAAQTGTRLPCPVCRARFKLPRAGATGLATNYQLCAVAEALQSTP